MIQLTKVGGVLALLLIGISPAFAVSVVPGAPSDQTASSASGNQPGRQQAPSTRTVAGGGLLAQVDRDALPDYSDVAVVAEVVRVAETRLTTADGGLPPLAELQGGDRWLGIDPVTDVTLRVVDVLGKRPAAAARSPAVAAIESGSEVVIAVPGGTYTFTLTAEEARLLNISTSDSDGPGSDTDVDLASPVEMNIAVSPSVLLTEGETYVLFLREHAADYGRNELIVFGGEQGKFPIHGSPAAELADVRALAATLNTADGPPRDLSELFGEPTE